MRQRDKDKIGSFQKAAKTINFDKIVLTKLETRAKQEGTNVSNMVNMLCRRHILTDAGFYKLMAKEHYLEFQRFKYMQEECMAMVVTK